LGKGKKALHQKENLHERGSSQLRESTVKVFEVKYRQDRPDPPRSSSFVIRIEEKEKKKNSSLSTRHRSRGIF
jgi:hypothetical protein